MPESDTFRGTARFGVFQDLAKLVVAEDRIELRGLFARERLEKDDGDYLHVDELSWPFGLRLVHQQDGTRGGGFWTASREPVVASLLRHGWRVEGL